MVWWIDSNRYCVCRSKFFYHEAAVDILNDRVFQTVNIMYSLDNRNYDKYEILSLIKSGVNIFNIDRTVHGEDFVQTIKELIRTQNLTELFPMKYRSPVGLAITMTANKPVDVDEGVDIVILKDVNNLEEFLHFKNKRKNTSIPLMVWNKIWTAEDLKPMIQFTDGVLLDVIDTNAIESYLGIVHLCKQAYKSVFIIIGDIVEDYQLLPADDLRILAVASKVIKYQFDGVMLFRGNDAQKNESQLVRSLVRAMHVGESHIARDYYELSFMIKTPVLPWISASLAASLAAKQSGASIIIVLTTSGISARWIAHASPPCHIVAVTSRKEIARRLHLHRKVLPLFYNRLYAGSWGQECWNRIVFGAKVALDVGLCSYGAKVGILAPSDQDIRYCNSLQILSIPLKCED